MKMCPSLFFLGRVGRFLELAPRLDCDWTVWGITGARELAGAMIAPGNGGTV